MDELQQHINGIIIYIDKATPVDLAADAQTGVYLCPCDITPRNFNNFEDGTVVALHFGATYFLPPVFFDLAVRKLVSSFAQKVAQRVHYPVLSDVKAMVAASYFLVTFGRNNIGLPKALLSRKL